MFSFGSLILYIIMFILFCFFMVLRSSIDDVRITQQGFEKRVVSQDLQLWLSNVSFFLFFYPSIFMYSSSGGVRLASYITIVILQAPPVDRKFTLLARAGRQVSSLRAFICLSLVSSFIFSNFYLL